MNVQLNKIVVQATNASSLASVETIQTLWSGYGQILRCHLQSRNKDAAPSVIVKHVQWPTANHHPRGWNTSRSHQRKVMSYRVETHWYQHWALRCDRSCRVPTCLAVESGGDDVLIVMEDLDAAGFEGRPDGPTTVQIHACVAWLANFHATFLGIKDEEPPTGLWPVGTYWHLETRPDELARLDDAALRAAASALDQKLSGSPFQTLVHGDAKLANFCFAADGRVAAVDFQYVGGGCGMKDLAYFISSCLSEDQCERREDELLQTYFNALDAALQKRDRQVDFAALEADWRALYPVAWTDFFRFLQGWSPGHWKIHRYSERLAREVLATL